MIEKIKKESYVMEEHEEKHPEEENCAHDMCCVCHENMVPGNRIANFGCPNNHKFHLECILSRGWNATPSGPLCDLREQKYILSFSRRALHIFK